MTRRKLINVNFVFTPTYLLLTFVLFSPFHFRFLLLLSLNKVSILSRLGMSLFSNVKEITDNNIVHVTWCSSKFILIATPADHCQIWISLISRFAQSGIVNCILTMPPSVTFYAQIYFPKYKFDLASCLKVPIARGTRMTEGQVVLKDDWREVQCSLWSILQRMNNTLQHHEQMIYMRVALKVDDGNGQFKCGLDKHHNEMIYETSTMVRWYLTAPGGSDLWQCWHELWSVHIETQ